eukprot:CAMPEP_0167797508 /NCGR_PEP_ID=MMETSP0111_2-20121227/15705_1 /TAXON_ID=91324 /ORGANISM="Lotharella globosa, Strain CCCM811" /LENGTH=163 /DNA_ID=CAMNT_0007691645 /DNA_START=58 /DNA_END=552 /DNA_ORIENTATION=+
MTTHFFRFKSNSNDIIQDSIQAGAKNGRKYPRRFLDGVHMNRVTHVKEVIAYRKKQWESRLAAKNYDILTMDLKVDTLRTKEDNDIANEYIEQVRMLLHKNPRWSVDQKRQALKSLFGILSDPDMWYEDWCAKHAKPDQFRKKQIFWKRGGEKVGEKVPPPPK